MSKEDILKNLIIDAIKSNPSANKKFNALKSDKLGEILRCYKESNDEYVERYKSSGGYDKISKNTGEYLDSIIREDITLRPEKTKGTLRSWLESDVWQDVVKKVRQTPDYCDFKIKFHEALDDLEEID